MLVTYIPELSKIQESHQIHFQFGFIIVEVSLQVVHNVTTTDCTRRTEFIPHFHVQTGAIIRLYISILRRIKLFAPVSFMQNIYSCMGTLSSQFVDVQFAHLKKNKKNPTHFKDHLTNLLERHMLYTLTDKELYINIIR